MGDLDIRLLLRQLRLKPEETKDIEQELAAWFKEWTEADQPPQYPRREFAEEALGTFRRVSRRPSD